MLLSPQEPMALTGQAEPDYPGSIPGKQDPWWTHPCGGPVFMSSSCKQYLSWVDKAPQCMGPRLWGADKDNSVSQTFLQNEFLLKNRQVSRKPGNSLLQLLEMTGHGLGGLGHSRTALQVLWSQGPVPSPYPLPHLDTGWNTQRPQSHCP